MSWLFAVIGAGASIAGTLAEADIRRDAANAEARLLESEADFILKQANFLAGQYRREERQINAQQNAAFVKGGVTLGFGTTINVMNETSRQMTREIFSMYNEAQYKSNLARAKAKAKREYADDITQAALISAIGGSTLSLGKAAAAKET